MTGKAHFVYNMLALDRYTITSGALPTGKLSLAVNVTYQGKPGELGKPAAVTIEVNGKQIGQGALPKTIPNKIALGEGVDIGTDLGSALDFTYNLPFTFTGKIDKVTFDLK